MTHPTQEILDLAEKIQAKLSGNHALAYCITCQTILYCQEVNNAATRRVLDATARDHQSAREHVVDIIRPQPVI